jgi:translation initiation factor 2 alpha subunit (eIF-2alpha)
MNLRAQLGELIEAFASAKASGNRTLIENSAAWLNQFMEKIEIIPKEEEVDVEG